MHPFHIPTLHTGRSTVRRLRPNDLEAVIAVRMSQDPSADPTQSRAGIEDWLAWTVRAYDQLESLHQVPYGERAIDVDGEVVGLVGLVPSFDAFAQLPSFGGQTASRRSAEVGMYWEVHAQHQRRGLAWTAARALATFAFEHLRVDRLIATTMHTNTASIAVMRKLGMHIERNPHPEPVHLQTVGILNAPS